METGFANTRSPKQITNVNVGAENTGGTAANPPEPGAAPPAPRPGTRGDDSGTGAPLAGARPERTAEPPPPATRSTGRHRPRPPGPALSRPVPRPPGTNEDAPSPQGNAAGIERGAALGPALTPGPDPASLTCGLSSSVSSMGSLSMPGMAAAGRTVRRCSSAALSGATRPFSPATTQPPPPRSAPDVPPSPLGLSIGSSTRPVPLVIGERVCLFVCMSARRVGGCVAGAARAGVRCPPRRVPSGTRVPSPPVTRERGRGAFWRSRRLPPLGRAPRHPPRRAVSGDPRPTGTFPRSGVAHR